MSTKIYVPTPLRSYAGHENVVEVEAATVGGALRALVERHAELRRHLYDEGGRLRRFVNVYRNDEDVRVLDGLDTTVADSDTVVILPAMAGGR